ncbi:MAG TPA: hypothetical protein DCS55_23330 [Acidimicrobiaceae bacterium]|nr:hypothetical protein [Acidimicrobiaceae bacterium]
MAINDRLRRARLRRDARARGLEVALGLGDEPPADRRPTSLVDLRCARCGGAGRLESLDLRTSRGLGRCSSCGTTWSIIYPPG